MTYQTKPKINAERLGADFNDLAEIGATIDGGVSRLALSNEDLEARAWLADRFAEAGLEIRDDDAGNLSGFLACNTPHAKTLLIGSHLDSVPNGGRYDGSVGVLAALECLRAIKEAGLTLPFHIEAINFTDEEGCWQSLFGSRALTGTLKENYLRDQEADYGPFRAALCRAGIRPADIYLARRDHQTIHGYLELHIEQSYWLDDAGIDIGVVTGVVGRATYNLSFLGEAAHNGTTRTSSRRDALRGASQFITQAHQTISEHFPRGVLNCANVVVEPGAFNMIPSLARVTTEIRHSDRDTLEQMQTAIIELAEATARTFNLNLEAQCVGRMPAATMAGSMVMSIEAACSRLGYSHTRLTSYAGHDAQILSGFTPSGMIFIPSVDGLSHSPKEFTRWPDVLKGVDVLLETILILAENTTS
ncbi:MAG: Zn-dependent hydrolase [Chloroflexota bacterium]